MSNSARLAALCAACVTLGAIAPASAPAQTAAATPHNVILFVPDGLREKMVDRTNAPAMDALQRAGVTFANSHSIFPTFTTANAASMATGHYLGDTGDFSNTIYSGKAIKDGRVSSLADSTIAEQSVTPFLENDEVLGDINDKYNGNYLDEMTVIAAARAAGYSTASVGKVGPVLIADPTARDGKSTIVVDDSTGSPVGIPLADPVRAAMLVAGLPLAPPTRGANGDAGTFLLPGTLVANTYQQEYFVHAATDVILPAFKSRNKPFVMMFWSRDPDGTQHNQGDSPDNVVPGINGPTSLAAIKNADNDLAALRAALDKLGLSATTDIIVAADHGFSTISKQSKTSSTIGMTFPTSAKGELPSGFLAIDLAKALGERLMDPDREEGLTVNYASGELPNRGNGLIGATRSEPHVIVAANGGSDLVYFAPGFESYAKRVVETLLAQDYVSGLFVDERLGSFPGTLAVSDINFTGASPLPRPGIVVNFRSFTTGCSIPTNCTAEVADSGLQQGQGMHGSFSRADTLNFMAAIGPDFKTGFIDRAPVSNADVGMTMARILGLQIPSVGTLVGRSMNEALRGGAMPAFTRDVKSSTPGPSGQVTKLNVQIVGTTRYFDAAGFAGQTVGL